ncbi:DNA polymerase III subunit delta' [uncultured Thiothrix sp.]|uniref:DNA polymerase III subunit delta' n=1 Tax=uncultured Thiothrix sp. TaxID=223185 RepID=UPI002613B632|nr:DNA polymerase III subunit delta' [uncultured Thiothrix sp.]
MMPLSAASYPWHQVMWQQIHLARQQQHLPHALLFTGSTGCGHEQMVYALAQSLLCLDTSEQGYACGSCRSCKVFASHSHPDFMLLALAEDKQAITVEQVRGLERFLELSRSYSPNRVALILNAEAMNTNAANSLLKSLEEPADNSYILLFTDKIAALMPTIRSRCQQLRLPLPTQAESLAWFEKQNLTQAVELLTLTGGRPLVALAEDASERLQQKILFLNQLKSVLTGHLSITEVASQWEKHDRQELLDWQLLWVKGLITHEVGGTDTGDVASVLRDLVKSQGIWLLYERLLELKALAAHPLNGRLFVENMLSLWL